METSLRLVLLGIGIIIVVGIIWDFRRSKNPSVKKANSSIAKPRFSFKSFFKKEKNDLDDFGDASVDDFEEVVVVVKDKKIKADPALYSEPKPKPKPKFRHQAPLTSPVAPRPEEIMLLHVMARPNSNFYGKHLIDAFNETHMFYGDMHIFHRYENMDGSGELMFSLVSAVEPGFFEVSKLETLMTPGLTLFFTITTPNQSIEALELMLRTAKQLAVKLEGEIRDDRRKPLTVQTIQIYRDRVRQESKELQYETR